MTGKPAVTLPQKYQRLPEAKILSPYLKGIFHSPQCGRQIVWKSILYCSTNCFDILIWFSLVEWLLPHRHSSATPDVTRPGDLSQLFGACLLGGLYRSCSDSLPFCVSNVISCGREPPKEVKGGPLTWLIMSWTRSQRGYSIDQCFSNLFILWPCIVNSVVAPEIVFLWWLLVRCQIVMLMKVRLQEDLPIFYHYDWKLDQITNYLSEMMKHPLQEKSPGCCNHSTTWFRCR